MERRPSQVSDNSILLYRSVVIWVPRISSLTPPVSDLQLWMFSIMSLGALCIIHVLSSPGLGIHDSSQNHALFPSSSGFPAVLYAFLEYFQLWFELEVKKSCSWGIEYYSSSNSIGKYWSCHWRVQSQFVIDLHKLTQCQHGLQAVNMTTCLLPP